MTTAAEGSQDHPLKMWAGHHYLRIQLLILILIIPGALSPEEGPWRWLLRVVGIALLALFCIAYLGRQEHKIGLCVRCAVEQNDVHEDSAIRYRWLLRFHHLFNMESRYLLISLFVQIGLFGVALFVLPREWGWIAAVIVFGWQSIEIYAENFHRKRVPWCPWCKDWGGGGQPEVVPEPDPVIEKVN